KKTKSPTFLFIGLNHIVLRAFETFSSLVCLKLISLKNHLLLLAYMFSLVVEKKRNPNFFEWHRFQHVDAVNIWLFLQYGRKIIREESYIVANNNIWQVLLTNKEKFKTF
ncbi:hypothetical protein LINPERHAP2_LOCUS24474, partial [Linum perenne]